MAREKRTMTYSPRVRTKLARVKTLTRALEAQQEKTVERSKLIVELVDRHGLIPRMIAEHVGISEEAVRKVISKARAA